MRALKKQLCATSVAKVKCPFYLAYYQEPGQNYTDLKLHPYGFVATGKGGYYAQSFSYNFDPNKHFFWVRNVDYYNATCLLRDIL